MAEFVGVTAPLYEDLISRGQNILIAGTTGSGKSTLMNGMINSILYKDNAKHQMYLVDPKLIEFSRYEDTAHCIRLATSPEEIEATLKAVLNMMEYRKLDMKERGIRKYDKTQIHLFIDELADLVLTSRKSTTMLQRICQLGRALGVQVIAATQCPLASVIPTQIKVNFPVVIGLHTVTAQHSRNILEVNGCEELPMYGEALIMYPTIGIQRTKVPLIPEDMIDRVIEEDRR